MVAFIEGLPWRLAEWPAGWQAASCGWQWNDIA
jgi:hypothetical protein